MFAGAGNVIAGGNFVTGGSGQAWGYEASVALHGVIGCVTSETTGGSCGSGALSAAFSKAMIQITGPMVKSDPLAGLAISSVVGGTASVLGGGKFANGARTAAFGYLFNAKLSAAVRARWVGVGGLLGGIGGGACAYFTFGGCAPAVPEFIAGGMIVGGLAGSAAADITESLSNIVFGTNSAPPVPGDLVGDQSDPRAGPSNRGKRHTSGPLTPGNGGTGDAEKDFDKLTGGTGTPFPGSDDRSKIPGAQVGDNGVWIRPGTKNPGDGPRIEIPGNGNKLPETLHY